MNYHGLVFVIVCVCFRMGRRKKKTYAQVVDTACSVSLVLMLTLFAYLVGRLVF